MQTFTVALLCNTRNEDTRYEILMLAEHEHDRGQGGALTFPPRVDPSLSKSDTSWCTNTVTQAHIYYTRFYSSLQLDQGIN